MLGELLQSIWKERLADDIARWRGILSATPRIVGTMDFETRSECDLKKHGSWNYAKHESTEAMCLYYKLPGGKRKLWHMAHPQHLISESPPPLDLFAYILAGGLMEAHNAFFERMIWMHVMAARHGWPAMPHLQWRCSAAKASAASLPRSLEGACKALYLPQQKDDEGHKLMMKMCKPRKLRKDEITAWMKEVGWTGRRPGKDNPALPVIYHGDLPGEEDDIYRNWAYCEQDIIAEEGLSRSLPPLSDYELEVWQMDQLMNERGVKFDLEMANAAIELFNEYKGRLNRELFQITGILGGSKREQVRAWLFEHEDVDLPDTKGETVDWLLKYKADEFSGRAKTVMEIMRAVNRTSTAKYQTMINKADPDDWRVRDLLMYWGGHTGRWSGKGVQVHNFPARDLIIKDFEEAAQLIKEKDIDWCLLLYGDIIKLVSHALRGAIIPDTDLEFMVADYSAIEARVVLWLAEATGALDIFRSGGDIYCDMATGIYGFEVSLKAAKDWTHPLHKLHALCRQFGKQSILGLGYGMGFVTFLLTCRKYDIVFSEEDVIEIMGKQEYRKTVKWVRKYLWIDPPAVPIKGAKTKDSDGKLQADAVRERLEEARLVPEEVVHELALMKFTVNVYRARYPEVKTMWKDQEAAAIKAVQDWTKRIVDRARKEHPEWVRPLSMTTKERKKAKVRMPIKARRWRDKITGPTIECGKINWVVKGGWLHCMLPSGRPIRYRDPEVSAHETSWGEIRPHLSYMHVVEGKWWRRVGTYGGKLVENITQAVARDIMAWAMVLTSRGDMYSTIMSVHDELVCEVRRNEGSISGFEALMSSIPDWADGCPIAAEAARMGRYRK